MAGIKQHTLPKFLMKGFAHKISKGKNKKAWVWWYHKGDKPQEKRTDKIGYENNFYGESISGSIDEKITLKENDYASLLHELRKLDKDIQVCDAVIPEFIAHLSVRTKHIRNVFANFSSNFSESFFSIFESENLAEFLNGYIKKHPDVFKNELEKMFTPEVAELLEPFIPTQYETDDFSEITEKLEQVKKQTIEKLPDSIKDGHLRGLEKSIAPEVRIKFYEQMNWFVLTSPQTLILGDFGCLVETDDERKFKVIPYELEEIKTIVLPIASNKMLVGTKLSEMPTVNFDEINKANAKCSREYFISSVLTTNFENLQSVIGTYTDFDMNEEIKTIMDDIRNI